MKYIDLLLFYVLTLSVPLSSNCQDFFPIFPNLYNQEALDSVKIHYKPNKVLNYSDARDYLYGTVFNQNDSVECVYSGHKLFLPSDVDPSIYLFQNGSNDGINCEHTFPRSKGADKENGNAYSDMHHLFPTRSQVNSGRENFPYAEIKDQETTHWYYQNEVKNFMPLSNINSYSERINGWFEPREKHKGNAARAVFYFYTMYKEEADEADLNFFDIQKETLCMWNLIDPIDEDEISKTKLIAEMQEGLGNPFILDKTLVNRCYCSEFTTSTGMLQKRENELFNVFPNPIQRNSTLLIDSYLDTEFQIQFFSVNGKSIYTQPFRIKKGGNRIQITDTNEDQLIYNIQALNNKTIHKSGILFIN